MGRGEVSKEASKTPTTPLHFVFARSPAPRSGAV